VRYRGSVVTIAVAVLGFAGYQGVHALRGPDETAPSCSWPARVENANPVQDGLIRCYLRAIAGHSAAGLRTVVPAREHGGPNGFEPAVFAHSADARNGEATATVTGNDVDDADATVDINYADGARDTLDIHIADPSSAKSWRVDNVGIFPPDPNAPSPVIT
jgi:hypothetical protein